MNKGLIEKQKTFMDVSLWCYNKIQKVWVGTYRILVIKHIFDVLEEKTCDLQKIKKNEIDNKELSETLSTLSKRTKHWTHRKDQSCLLLIIPCKIFH